MALLRLGLRADYDWSVELDLRCDWSNLAFFSKLTLQLIQVGQCSARGSAVPVKNAQTLLATISVVQSLVDTIQTLAVDPQPLRILFLPVALLAVLLHHKAVFI